MNVQSILLSSLDKVFLDEAPISAPHTAMSALRGEVASFQWMLFPERGERMEVVISIESPITEHIYLYEVGHVPVGLANFYHSDQDFIRRKPGLYPDPLFPCKDGKIPLVGGQWRGVWVETKIPNDLVAGEYTIRLTATVANQPEEQLASAIFTMTVIDAVLPVQTLMYTNWFHNDCLAVHYKVPVFSEEHWLLIERYMRNAADYGMNMILVPLFTPPLDTAVGGERPTVQLVDVTVDGETCRFGFDRLKRYLAIAKKTGMRYFEMAHLFTQWGAAHAPKIVGMKNGEEVRLFGWETDSVSLEYTGFLRQFLPELKSFLKEEGIFDACFFHLSDEPSINAINTYKAARNSIHDLLEDCHVIDALSNIEFYREGLVSTPIPSNDHIQPFIDEGVPELWTYYCCGQTNAVSNRMMDMPAQRNRVLGWQLYRFDIKGFLHWGYNFWFTALSTKAINPYAVTDAGLYFPSGDAFIVYPGEDGHPVGSTRQNVFLETLQDMRALQLLESLTSRKVVEELLAAELGADFSFKTYPRDRDTLLNLRKKVNTLISHHA